MKERPILFSGPMVRALLAGTKTQTRRVVLVPSWADRRDGQMVGAGQTFIGTHPGTACESPRCAHIPGPSMFTVLCPYGVPGDRLWVRETFWPAFKRCASSNGVAYRADYLPPARTEYGSPLDPSIFHQKTWTPAIFMPRWASRITLEVTAVRVERLQDISEEDAKAEGAQLTRIDTYPGVKGWTFGDGKWWPKASTAFSMGWDTINGKRAPWASNPWVWVVTFRRVRP